jgi:glucose-6-phosphate isomerase
VISLAAQAGIDAWVERQTGALRLGDDLVSEEVAVRELAAAREVYERAPDEAPPLYHMLNGITPRSSPEPDSELRYELTSLRPGTVGTEWVKTIGHVHNLAPDGVGYPEAYEVITGVALFVLFRLDQAISAVVEARPGDRFVIPPGWHHLAVNAGSEAMVFADVVARAVVPDYALLFERRGAPVYLGPGETRPNPHWSETRVVRIACRALSGPGPLADAFLGDRSSLDYLLRPAAYLETWQAFDEALASHGRNT